MKINRCQILFCLILLLGILIRVWSFPANPPGLNVDEAITGVDAYDLLHYGVDSNGVSFPVHAISYGSGQNTPYIYLLAPFLALGGLSIFTLRLPMLLLGIATLPMVFYAGRRIINQTFGLIAMFFIAVSPWHIMISRWGLESNTLPFIFLAAFIFLLKSESSNRWFILASFLLGICPYAYGSAFVVVPIVAAAASLVLFLSKRVQLRTMLVGWGVLVVAAAPMLLYVLVNHFGWESIHLGFITIPRLPAPARFDNVLALNSPHILSALKNNAYTMLRLIWFQDKAPYSMAVEPYGYFYTYTGILGLLGMIGLLPLPGKENRVEKWLLLIWLGACLPVGILESLIMNRFNIFFIPFIICMAVPLTWLNGRLQVIRWLLLGVLLVAFAGFTRGYFSPDYSYVVGRSFYDGIIPAVQSAQQSKEAPICVTDKVAEPYIYTLFAEPVAPREFLASAKFKDPNVEFRFVNTYGRYSFGLKNCTAGPQTIYVLGEGEQPPDSAIQYQVEEFSNYKVYKP